MSPSESFAIPEIWTVLICFSSFVSLLPVSESLGLSCPIGQIGHGPRRAGCTVAIWYHSTSAGKVAGAFVPQVLRLGARIYEASRLHKQQLDQTVAARGKVSEELGKSC